MRKKESAPQGQSGGWQRAESEKGAKKERAEGHVENGMKRACSHESGKKVA